MPVNWRSGLFLAAAAAAAVRGFRFAGADRAELSAPLVGLGESGIIDGIVICPSNPWLSVAPMLVVAPLRDAGRQAPAGGRGLAHRRADAAVKGPEAAKIMRELGVEVSALGAVRYYGALVDGWVLDVQDAARPRLRRRT